MRHSGVTGPVQSCNVNTLGTTTSRFLAVQLLDGNTLYFAVEPKSKTKELYNQTCAHLAARGMLDTDLFGLSVFLDDEYLFIDPDCKISKYAAKNWRSSSSHGLDNMGKPLLTFHFRVQFYVDTPLLLRDETSKHYYYLQIRQNIICKGQIYTCVPEEVLYLLVGLALQADYGDYNKSIHSGNYFPLQNYFPQSLLENVNESNLYRNASIVHQANHSFPKTQAETQFIREASTRDLLTLSYNSHLYRLKQKKQEPNPGSLWLAICTRGIELYEEKTIKPISGTLYWNNIGKLCFDRKKFEIRSLSCPTEKLTYYTSSDDKSKHLLMLCRLTHQFCMQIQLKAAELARKEEEEKRQYREWGADISNLKLNNVCYTHRTDQRVSVISNTSSNTTSGIVSDRVHSLDESEDDLEMEIMINSPPAASVESLALAHLRDNFNKPCKISPNFSSMLQKEKHDGALTPPVCLTKTNVAITPALTDGSQCSSSCSTVVVNGVPSEHSSTQAQNCNVLTANRRHSTNSSLELGYSHTAQNSAISDSASCLELDYSVQSAHTSSGIYTLQSSCETNTVATATAACSSETSGICHSVIEDSEGGITRSGSIISTSGSFHGDGSDPSDTGHGTPLTAEELSDLIVGRSPKPCRGKYPSVATVSESLDSVADYVTLPPPPIPPQYHDSSQLSATEFMISQRNADFIASKGGAKFGRSLRGPLSSNMSSSPSLNKFMSEEAVLQQQIQFQHLAASCSPHLLMNTLPGQSLMTKPQISSISHQQNASACINDNKCYRNENNMSFGCPQSEHYQQNHKSYNSLLYTDENNSKFINTKPQTSILKGHTTYAPSFTLPNYMKPVLPQHSSQFGVGYHHCYPSNSRSGNVINSHETAMKSKHRCPQSYNAIPIVGSNNYLDFRRNGAALLQQIHEKFPPPPPPAFHTRQPPPPPPLPPPRNQFIVPCSTYYQLEQYKQQLYSDVDYVMYPIKDPALSKQEYLDSKLALKHCSQLLPSVPPSCLYGRKSHLIYRSTPNVAVAGNCIPNSSRTYCPAIKYASNQNLSSECLLNSAKYSSTSPLYSAAVSSYSSSTQSLRYDPNAYLTSRSSNSSCSFMRTQSHDNILNCYLENVPSASTADLKTSRPPPPPPPYGLQTLSFQNSNKHTVSHNSGKTPTGTLYKSKMNPAVSNVMKGDKLGTSSKDGSNISLDICSLREKSRNLDLPLISALCNDRSLLKQTNTIDTCNAKDKRRPLSWHIESNRQNGTLLDSVNIDISTNISEVSSSSDKAAKKNVLYSTSKSSGNLSTLVKSVAKDGSYRSNPSNSKTHYTFNQFSCGSTSNSNNDTFKNSDINFIKGRKMKARLENKSNKNAQC